MILDEYTKNRDVHTCPSTKVESAATFIVGWPNYIDWDFAYEGVWGDRTMDVSWMEAHNVGPCHYAWPSGCGRGVTDSCAQEALATNVWLDEFGNKAFTYSLSGNEADLADVKLVQTDDPVRLIVVYPAGVYPTWHDAGLTGYPDICAMSCGNCGGGSDWEGCTWPEDCGLFMHAPADGSMLAEPDLRRQYARHLGGVNLGFADGHAAWYSSEALMTLMSPEDHTGWAPWGPAEINLSPSGSGHWGPGRDCGHPGPFIM